jgi:hypothetical protein
MTSAVQPIQSMPLNPVDLVQAYTPSQIDSISRAGEVAPGASAIQSISEREVTFSKLMATSGASDSSQAIQTSDKWWNVLPSGQTTDTQKTNQTSATGDTSSTQSIEQVFNTLPKEQQNAILELIADLKKVLTPTEYQVLKDGWAGKLGTDLQLGIVYFFWFQSFNNQGIQILNSLDEALKNQ